MCSPTLIIIYNAARRKYAAKRPVHIIIIVLLFPASCPLLCALDSTTVRGTKTRIMHPKYGVDIMVYNVNAAEGVSRANNIRRCDLLGKNCLNPPVVYSSRLPRSNPAVYCYPPRVATAGRL